jgi:type I site-specific restriction endonuclease
MNEAETRAELVDPALREAGWGVVADSRVRRETICPGRIEGAGRRGKPEIADYVLIFRNHKLAVIEAKARDKGDTEGVAQAKAYAEKLQARFAFSTNGRRIYRPAMRLVDDVGVFLADQFGFLFVGPLKFVQILEKQDPRRLFCVVEFRCTAGLFPENVVDILEGLFEHPSFI